MRKLGSNFRMFLWMTILTGIIYPLLVTGIVQVTMKKKADGNFLISKERVVGATLIGQKFESDKYFWSRPSSIDYNPLPSGGSNLGPTSAALKKAVEERKEKIGKAQNIPAELLFSSGSGLDPHISIPTAYFQLERIAKARGISQDSLKQIITQHTTPRFLGFLGEECVNVLLLNQTLDELSH